VARPGLQRRSHPQVTGLLGGLLLAAPGVVPVSEWRPDHAPLRAASADVYAGLATMPGSKRHLPADPGPPGRDLGRNAGVKASAR
jgi:S-adenosyl methyltransferase